MKSLSISCAVRLATHRRWVRRSPCSSTTNLPALPVSADPERRGAPSYRGRAAPRGWVVSPVFWASDALLLRAVPLSGDEVLVVRIGIEVFAAEVAGPREDDEVVADVPNHGWLQVPAFELGVGDMMLRRLDRELVKSDMKAPPDARASARAPC